MAVRRRGGWPRGRGYKEERELLVLAQGDWCDDVLRDNVGRLAIRHQERSGVWGWERRDGVLADQSAVNEGSCCASTVDQAGHGKAVVAGKNSGLRYWPCRG